MQKPGRWRGAVEGGPEGASDGATGVAGSLGSLGGVIRGGRLREAIYGTIVLLSVLGYLDEHPITAGSAAAAVAGTAVVLFLAQAYAEIIAELIDRGHPPTAREYGHFASRVWPVLGVAVPPLILIGVAGARLMTVSVALDVAFWLGAASLTGWGWAAGQAAHRGRWAAPLTALASICVGLVLAGLKAAFD